MATRSSKRVRKRPLPSQCSGRLCVVETAILIIAVELLLAQGVLAIGDLLQPLQPGTVTDGSVEATQVPVVSSEATSLELFPEFQHQQQEQDAGEDESSILPLTSSVGAMDWKGHEDEPVVALPSSRDKKQWSWGGRGSSAVPGVLTVRGGSNGSRHKRHGGRKVALPEEMGDGDEFLDLLVHHASAIYIEDTVALAAWNCSRCTIPPVSQFLLTSLIIDTDAKLEAFVGVHHDKQKVVVCFRGTHSTYIRNWIDDLWALPLDMNFPGVEHALVHAGFYYAYHKSTLKPRVSEEVLRLLAANPSYPVAITGHSLGAALASFCSLDLVLNFNVPWERLWLATFGSPRVGNPVFAEYFKQHLPYSVRVTHGRDIVVHLPPHTPYSAMGYHHVAQELWYHRTSWFLSDEVQQTCDESGEDLSCSRSVAWTSLVDHLKYLGVPLC